MQARSAGCVEVVEEPGEEFGAVGLVVVGGVVALAGEDGDELFAGLEEAAPFADRFVDAVERRGPVAVAVAEEAPVVWSPDFAWVMSWDGGLLVTTTSDTPRTRTLAEEASASPYGFDKPNFSIRDRDLDLG